MGKLAIAVIIIISSSGGLAQTSSYRVSEADTALEDAVKKSSEIADWYITASSLSVIDDEQKVLMARFAYAMSLTALQIDNMRIGIRDNPEEHHLYAVLVGAMLIAVNKSPDVARANDLRRFGALTDDLKRAQQILD